MKVRTYVRSNPTDPRAGELERNPALSTVNRVREQISRKEGKSRKIIFWSRFFKEGGREKAVEQNASKGWDTLIRQLSWEKGSGNRGRNIRKSGNSLHRVVRRDHIMKRESTRNNKERKRQGLDFPAT